jgi:Cys-tRNA(Pro)/Cys-tRNA(Cys) deacylase
MPRTAIERAFSSSMMTYGRGMLGKAGKDSVDLEAYLNDSGVWYRFLDKPETVHTADASHTTGIDLSKITKNLVCRTSEGRYALLIIPGDRRVNLQKAAQALNARNVQLLNFREAEEVSGYPPGGTPSVHHKTQLEVIVDNSVLAHETLFCGGGTRTRLLELKTSDVLKLSGAIPADISLMT